MYTATTQTISTVLTQAAAFLVTAPSVTVTSPDGTSSGPLTVTVSPTTSATTHTLSAAFTPTIGGSHTRVWTYSVGAQPYTITEQFWVTWYECYAQVRTNIGATSRTLTDDTLGAEFESLVLKYGAMANFLYKDLTGTDRRTFDTAMSWMMSSELRSTTSKSGAIGELVGFKKGTTYLQYAGRAETPKSPEELWWRKGLEILMTIPLIAGVLENTDYTNVLPTRGPVIRGNVLGTQGNAVSLYTGGEMG